MTEISDFGLIVLAVSATVFVALLGMRLADRLSLPYAAVILVGAMALAETSDSIKDVLSILDVERLTVVALVVILFDGGLHIGFRRFRESFGPILAVGVLGTFATAGLVANFCSASPPRAPMRFIAARPPPGSSNGPAAHRSAGR